jgi:hypothetical protein
MVGGGQVNPHHRDPVTAGKFAGIGARITAIR